MKAGRPWPPATPSLGRFGVTTTPGASCHEAKQRTMTRLVLPAAVNLLRRAVSYHVWVSPRGRNFLQYGTHEGLQCHRRPATLGASSTMKHGF